MSIFRAIRQFSFPYYRTLILATGSMYITTPNMVMNLFSHNPKVGTGSFH